MEVSRGHSLGTGVPKSTNAEPPGSVNFPFCYFFFSFFLPLFIPLSYLFPSFLPTHTQILIFLGMLK